MESAVFTNELELVIEDSSKIIVKLQSKVYKLSPPILSDKNFYAK